jgi:hypothetical protein
MAHLIYVFTYKPYSMKVATAASLFLKVLGNDIRASRDKSGANVEAFMW